VLGMTPRFFTQDRDVNIFPGGVNGGV